MNGFQADGFVAAPGADLAEIDSDVMDSETKDRAKRTHLHRVLGGAAVLLLLLVIKHEDHSLVRADDVDPVQCFEAIEEQTLLGDDQALRLCEGAADIEPARCYIEAQIQTLLSDDSMIALCKCAESIEPVTCFDSTKSNTFLSDQQILDVCSARATRNLTFDCYQLPRNTDY